eukprot:scaffold54883_cov31-Tisochrysis_lutea.AAC.6
MDVAGGDHLSADCPHFGATSHRLPVCQDQWRRSCSTSQERAIPSRIPELNERGHGPQPDGRLSSIRPSPFGAPCSAGPGDYDVPRSPSSLLSPCVR